MESAVKRVATPAGVIEVPPGMAYDRVSYTLVTVEQMRRREAEREERRFLCRANQGEFPTPHIMRDFRHYEPTRMTDGTIVTSRAEKREYQARTGLVDYEPIQHEKDHWTADYHYREDLAQDLKRTFEMDVSEVIPTEKAWEEAGFTKRSQIEAVTDSVAASETATYVTPSDCAAQDA